MVLADLVAKSPTGHGYHLGVYAVPALIFVCIVAAVLLFALVSDVRSRHHTTVQVLPLCYHKWTGHGSYRLH